MQGEIPRECALYLRRLSSSEPTIRALDRDQYVMQEFTGIQLRLTFCRLTGRPIWYTKPVGSRKTALSDDMRRSFDDKQISCVEYANLTLEQEREIFSRVQNGVALTPAGNLSTYSMDVLADWIWQSECVPFLGRCLISSARFNKRSSHTVPSSTCWAWVALGDETFIAWS